MKFLCIPVVGLLFMASCSNSAQDPPDDNGNLNNNSNDNGPGQEDPGFPCDFDAECNDGVACNGQERCVSNLCQPGTPPCDEGLICDEETRRCLECRQDSDCDDGVYCNGPESCITTTGRCRSGDAPCGGNLCDEATRTCAGCTVDVDCDDGQACTADTCVDGACQAVPSEDCCDQDTDCDDSNPCTVDTCANSACQNVALSCDNGVYCDGMETCNNGTCVDGADPCPAGQNCDEAARACNGNPPQGACCTGGGNCQVLTQSACSTQSGAYSGDGTNCTGNPCSQPAPTGACCLSGATCQVLTQAACAAQSGSYNGNGSACTAGLCGSTTPTGACCQPGGSCNVTTQTACTSGGGTYKGNNVSCAAAQCSAPVSCGDAGAGSCCTVHGTPSCDDAACCNTICDVDPFCCDTDGEWDDICVFEARTLCGSTCPLANDNCADAIAIADGMTAFDTIGADTDGPENPIGLCDDDGENQTHHDIWYRYTATCTGSLTVSTCLQNDEEGYDTDIVVYGDCTCPASVTNLLGCNDDGCEFRSLVVVPVVQGQCYLIRIGGWSSEDMGTGMVTLTCQ